MGGVREPLADENLKVQDTTESLVISAILQTWP